MRIDEIKKVCFVGAGTMGCYNSLLAGIAGYDTVVYDISEDGSGGRFPVARSSWANFWTAMGTFDKAAVMKGRRPDLSGNRLPRLPSKMLICSANRCSKNWN